MINVLLWFFFLEVNGLMFLCENISRVFMLTQGVSLQMKQKSKLISCCLLYSPFCVF
jgi:hypothetical protein